MSIYTNRDGQSITTGQELGRGGEGAVFTVIGRSELVAKIYHPALHTPERQAKLAAMVSRPPQDGCRLFSPPHVSLAWPTELLLEQGNFAGFLMPRIERSPNLIALFNPKLRQKRFPQANRRFLYHTAQNLAATLAALHASGCVMGDLNQKNILVKANALITLVDTDSFQVGAAGDQLYRCPVGVPEYTPPELQDKPLAAIDRHPYHDCFGLSVLIFQLLMEGYHPFTGHPLSSALAEVEQLSLHCMTQGLFPYQRNVQVEPPPAAPPFRNLDSTLQHLFVQSFVAGYTSPSTRPTAQTWAQALCQAEAKLVRCRRHPDHWYEPHLAYCPICGPVRIVAPPIRQPTSVRREPYAGATAASHAQPGGVPHWLVGPLAALGALYFVPLVILLLVGGFWLIPVLLLVGLGNPQVRFKTWQWAKVLSHWLTPMTGQLWQRKQFRQRALLALAALLLWALGSFFAAPSGEQQRLLRESPGVESPLFVSPLVTPSDRP